MSAQNIFCWEIYESCSMFWFITKTGLFKYTENFTTKTWKFSDKTSDIFHISAQNIDCGYLLELPHRGSSNEYPQSMFLSRNKKKNAYLSKHQFCCIKVGLRGSKLYRHVFVMWIKCLIWGYEWCFVLFFFFFFFFFFYLSVFLYKS